MEKGDKQFKIRDKVYCLVYGNGVITDIGVGTLNIYVEFENGSSCYYTIDGTFGSKSNKILYHGHDLLVSVTETKCVYQVLVELHTGTYELSLSYYESVEDYLSKISVTKSSTYKSIVLFEPSKKVIEL